MLIQRVTTAGVTTQYPGTIAFVFNTVPALHTWSDSAGGSGTVSYPVAAPSGPGTGGPGTMSNPFPVAPGPNGHVVLTLTFWRPQRSGIAGAGEPAFMDIGHLAYHSEPHVLSGGPSPAVTCPASSYSTSDPSLVPGTFGIGGMEGDLVDQADDAPANPAKTLTYSLDLTACFSANGATLSSGNIVGLDISARTTAGTSVNTTTPASASRSKYAEAPRTARGGLRALASGMA